MAKPTTHITVCICTYKRPLLLKGLLEKLKNQDTEELFSYSIVVTDNDRQETAKSVVCSFADNVAIRTTYCVEATPNIAMARNKAVRAAEGDYIAFIDDDEFPARNWLLMMLRTIFANEAAGVLGPVLPHFEVE